MPDVLSGSNIDFDPLSQEFFADPYPTYKRLRDEAPVYYSEQYGFYALSRYHDVLRAHRDAAVLSSAHGVRLWDLLKPDFVNQSSIIGMDEPEHTRQRKLVNRVFTPRAVAGLEPMIREIITGYLDQFEGRDQFDIVADFSAPFPIQVISGMLGVPKADREQLRHWFDLVLHREEGEHSPSPEGIAAYGSLHEYFHELAQDKRRHPADDMMSRLVEVSIDRGEAEGATQLTDKEISSFGVLLGGAGAETVAKAIGNGVVLFYRNPGEWVKIVENPEIIPKAVDEVIRYWAPSQYVGRLATEETTYSGHTIPAQAPVLLLTGAACRDERAFDDPDRFNVTRTQPVSVHFGHGIHACLGAALARLETRIAFEEISRRWPRYEVDETNCRRVTAANVSGYSNVPVSVESS
ncbi:cytochrome P450 [Mycobacterium sp. CVI_P3]|uniref:Cytochrome P450 n=1 Tax=Mycobacterium pinniadriaticum TaxID=2994102 RepID=A0ABT3SFJ5_9MYCO|nr:cytochrome P450 [Mycobacterium pinniadriaticum]MCX2931768.1 cytochrome P450 [Mycobacterium pinniadriaticum]MCX2938157.1 cytochrome P450 [Mycobacterium pinniadriaticum]